MNLSRRITSLIDSKYAVPVALLITTGLAYAISFWRLGFYWDDQPISWIRYQLGPAATVKYFSDSRPVWGLLYVLTGYILPYQPAYWQLFAMLLRAAASLAIWLVMENLFPERRYAAFLLALLVLLYPGFNQQWVSYLYAHFFIVLCFLLFSWYLMLRGKTIPAVILSALNLVMFEYFFTLELIRPLIIYQSLQDPSLPKRERLWRTLRQWLPYLGAIVFAVLYRRLVYTHPGFGYSLPGEIVRAPVATLAELGTEIASSLWLTAVAAWLQVFQFPNPASSGLRIAILYVVVVTVIGVLAFLFGRLDKETRFPDRNRFAVLLVCIGLILLLLGGVPFWVTDLPVSLAFPASRATLSFMLGACVLLLGVIEFLPGRFKYVVPVLLIGLSAGRQYLWSADYARDWQTQKNMFWQMYWRAPGIQPHTIVLLNQGPLQFNADNSLTPALNWVFDPDHHAGMLNYVLFYPTSRRGGTLPELIPGQPITYSLLAEDFSGNTSQALSFYFSPPGCLRLLDAEIDAANRLIPDESLMRDAAGLSSSNWISATPSARMPQIYYPEPAHGWCYYFEKADLAGQIGDWARVVQLGDEAFRLNDYPNDPIERFVFIEGYAHVGNWMHAEELARQSYEVSPRYVGPLLCKLMQRIDQETPASNAKQSSLNDSRTRFSCLP